MNHPNFLCSSTEMEHPWRIVPDEYTRQPTCLESLDSMPYSSLPYVPITKRHKLGPKTGLRFLGYAPSNIFGVHSPNTWSLTIG